MNLILGSVRWRRKSAFCVEGLSRWSPVVVGSMDEGCRWG